MNAQLSLFDPSEPSRILPQDDRAWFTVNWMSPQGHLNRQRAYELDEMETVFHLVQGQPNVYTAQCLLDRPVRQHPYVLYGTHSFSDLDTYNVPRLAGLSTDEQVRTVRQHCDDTEMPLPSAIIGSGRGLYLKYYWRSPVGREGVGRMVAVNRALVKRFSSLGADPKATDATRLLRITGSEHSRAQRIVDILHLEQRDGRTITFDFDAFARQIAPSVNEAPPDGVILPPVAMIDRERKHQPRPEGWAWSQEGWFWAQINDCWTLAAMRYPQGVVPEGQRDIFGHVIAACLARIWGPPRLYREIVAAVSKILPADYVARDLQRHSSTLLHNAREAYQTRNWTKLYRYPKARVIDLLEITPAEERHMAALISDGEKHRRHLERWRTQRRASGMVERAEYEATAEQRRTQAVVMRGRGMSLRAIAAALGISHERVRQYLRG